MMKTKKQHRNKALIPSSAADAQRGEAVEESIPSAVSSLETKRGGIAKEISRVHPKI
jgi:hypothetical protein